MFVPLLQDGQILETGIAEMRGFDHLFKNLLSCTTYEIEVDLIWEWEDSIDDINGKAIPPLTKSIMTHPDITKEVKISTVEGGRDFITFKLTGILFMALKILRIDFICCSRYHFTQ